MDCWRAIIHCQPRCDDRPFLGAKRCARVLHQQIAIHAANVQFVAVSGEISTGAHYTVAMNAASTPATPANAARPSLFGFRHVMRHWWTFDADRPGAGWQYLVATAIYNSIFAVILTVGFVAFDSRATWWTTFWQTLLVSNCIGFSIHLLMELVFGKILPRSNRKPPAWQTGVIASFCALLGIYIGYTVAFALLGRNFTALMAKYPRFALGMLLVGLLGCVLWVLIMDGQTRRIRAEAEQARHNEERQRLAMLTKSAELRALQAQIEPHFLFNTLANVQALIDYEPQKAKRMLDSFITHLRQSLDASRQTHATLGSEIDLIHSYLQILSVRMGERLTFEIECPEHLRATPFAPLLLQPLVENAVKYGLEPKIEGGTIRVRVSEQNRTIRVEVDDDGVGLSAKSSARAGTGTGIANVRERLASIYGANASLDVVEKTYPERGTLSTISLSTANT
jgi:signal transduction histidine kinase